jgi:hypothetical protein
MSDISMDDEEFMPLEGNIGNLVEQVRHSFFNLCSTVS